MSSVNFESLWRKLAGQKKRHDQPSYAVLSAVAIRPQSQIIEESSGPLRAINYREDAKRPATSRARKRIVGQMKKRYGG